MKNKKVLYFLVPAVILIWSAIGYRIYTGVGHEGIQPHIHQAANRHQQQVPDTQVEYSLLLDYSDPFLSHPLARAETGSYVAKAPVAATVPVAPKAVERVPQAAAPELPPIVYLGKIENAERKAAVVLVKIHNQSFMLKEGDTELEVTLKKVWRDSILVEYRKVRKVVGR